MKISMIPNRLVTAGQYADFLNDYLNLQPGFYVCRMISFDIPISTGGEETIYTPLLSFSLEVKENMISVDLGEFEVEIK